MSIFKRRLPAHPDCEPEGFASLGDERIIGAEDGTLYYVHLWCPRDGQIVVEVKGYLTFEADRAKIDVLNEHRTRGVRGDIVHPSKEV